MRLATLLTLSLLALVAPASAQFSLQVTEIWPGNEPGENLTADWFELTNVGDVAWTPADGDLYFDDDSQDASVADPLMGISSIAPGESVIFIDDDTTDEFAALWGAVAILPQLGTYAGSGLSQGGDAVTIFLSNGQPTGITDIIEVEAYPDADFNGGQSYDVVLGEFSTVGNASGALATIEVNDFNQVAIASVGPAVPEPTTLAIAGFAVAGLAATRRR